MAANHKVVKDDYNVLTLQQLSFYEWNNEKLLYKPT